MLDRTEEGRSVPVLSCSAGRDAGSWELTWGLNRRAGGRACRRQSPHTAGRRAGMSLARRLNFGKVESRPPTAEPRRPRQRTAAMSDAAPAQYKQKSRKGKKAWRKNVDVTEVASGLDEVRGQIITG